MAKRFTDTEKWKKPFIRNLSSTYKLLWFYICDDCDHAGIWQVDFEVAKIRIGEDIDMETAVKNFSDKIVIIDNGDKWYIPSFIEFQYPSGLSQNNKAHGGVIKILEKYDLYQKNIKGLVSPLQGVQDMDMDMELVMGMDNSCEIEKNDILANSIELTNTTNYKDLENYLILKKYKPDNDFLKLPLPKNTLQLSLMKFVKSTEFKNAKEQDILDFWELFKLEFFTGERYYSRITEIYTHFGNWIKFQKISKKSDFSNNGNKSEQPKIKL